MKTVILLRDFFKNFDGRFETLNLCGFLIFLAFCNAFNLNNQKMLWLPWIIWFQRKPGFETALIKPRGFIFQNGFFVGVQFKFSCVLVNICSLLPYFCTSTLVEHTIVLGVGLYSRVGLYSSRYGSSSSHMIVDIKVKGT